MSHIHIVEPYHSKAMLQMAAPLMELTNFERMTIGEKVDGEADLNFHIPWHGLTELWPTKSLQGMLYTHLNPGAKDNLISACKRADFIVAMSHVGKKELVDLGIPAGKITVIYAGHTDYKPRPLRIGVIGYEQPNGRKRGHILLDLCWQMDVSPFEFVIAGGGWDDIVQKMANAGARVTYLGEVADEKMQEIYDYIDVLLVTSYVEGGPLTVLEALGAGKQVIAPPIGYANDLQGIYWYMDIDGLCKELNFGWESIAARRRTVEQYTWALYAQKHAELFERMLCQNTSTLTQTDTSALSPTA